MGKCASGTRRAPAFARRYLGSQAKDADWDADADWAVSAEFPWKMSRRSERLRLRYHLHVDGDGGGSSTSSSGCSSPVVGQHIQCNDSSLRTRRRKSSRVKGLSPSPLLATITCSTPGSSSGYRSEDDCAGHSLLDQPGSASNLKNRASPGGPSFWMAIHFSGWLFGLLRWCLHNTWYRLTTAVSLQDIYVFTRSFSTGKKLLLSVLGMLFLVALLDYGAWYFYPSGLRTFHPAMLSWLAAKGSSRRQDVCESGEFTPDFQELESGVLQHMSEWQGLSQEDSQDKRPKEMASLEAQLAGLRQELAAISQRQAAMAQEIHLWREKMVALRSDMESHVPALIQEYFVGDKGTKAGLTQLEEVQAQLWDLEQRLLRHMAEEQDKTASKVAADLRLTLLEEGVTTGVTEEEVREIVRQALKLYSEDRIGLVDYALESSGASILSSHSSETYGTRTAVISLFGIPLWYHFQTQRAIIQPNVYPGNCWAFRGPQGFVGVRLSARIHLTAVTLEHVPRALSPVSNITSAPKDFVILGLNEDSQVEGVALAKFTYDNAGEAIQTFHFQGNGTAPYQLVQLQVLSNWGHPDYTCIYRFRVHGKPAN
uniref:SUN domain-containing protein 2-like n=1 Tax=Phascolarctos cinereus TaxID=38626 RepID=A0A6P5JWA3_PHACI|nr:SUN domain-containing protein 2-like [Phascolarctos cinereus]